ncbi:DUF3048 domain-containing protein [Clostridium swellfunianum]|uniref:DUF3048 domain-containing protein n=1 Tax=Clostridium swellfunianum TaxID=1367462 RepID=UPI00202E5D06|nr:DUF3048 domain-containing protein [Clostridium swellfunianum]MCM0647451.1 DUF3048 domain-containing protein [Clostridium swellfunianum]
MRSKNILCAAISVVVLLTGCSSKKASTVKPDATPSTTQEDTNPKSVTSSEQKYYAPYTGEEVNKEVLSNVPFLTSVENSPAARPQSGLNSADIVFELMSEGGVTRFFALFQKESAPKIGPVRSVRTYFIDIAYEYNLPFGHCGGSSDADERIKNENLMSMNEMFNGSYYWRDPSIKVREHGLYTSSEKLITLANKKGYAKPASSNLKFDKSFWDNISSSVANSASIRFNGAYTTSYTFKDGLYYKAMNNVPSVNKEDTKPIAVKNVVIQNVNYRSRVNSPNLDADLIGQGNGYIISNGKAVKVSWSRSDLKSQTVFKDEKGNIVPLNPGKTWWHILDQEAKLTLAE